MKVIAFNGSPRKDGNTAILIRVVLSELQNEGVDTELVQLAGHTIRGCIACMKCRESKNLRCAQAGDIVNESIQKMIQADGIILGSPTYFADLTPEMKALIDRCGYVIRNNGPLLKHKVGAAVVAVRRAGAIHVLDSLHHFFLIQQMIVPGSSYWTLGIGRNIGEVEADEEGIRTMRDLGQSMAWLLKKLRAPTTSTVDL